MLAGVNVVQVGKTAGVLLREVIGGERLECVQQDINTCGGAGSAGLDVAGNES